MGEGRGSVPDVMTAAPPEQRLDLFPTEGGCATFRQNRPKPHLAGFVPSGRCRRHRRAGRLEDLTWLMPTAGANIHHPHQNVNISTNSANSTPYALPVPPRRHRPADRLEDLRATGATAVVLGPVMMGPGSATAAGDPPQVREPCVCVCLCLPRVLTCGKGGDAGRPVELVAQQKGGWRLLVRRYVQLGGCMAVCVEGSGGVEFRKAGAHPCPRPPAPLRRAMPCVCAARASLRVLARITPTPTPTHPPRSGRLGSPHAPGAVLPRPRAGGGRAPGRGLGAQERGAGGPGRGGRCGVWGFTVGV